MRSKRYQILFSIFLVSLFIVGCGQKNLSNLDQDNVSENLAVEDVSPTESVEAALDPTEAPTQTPLPTAPTASIEYIEYYYSEFEDFDDWVTIPGNEQNSYSIDITDGGLALSLEGKGDNYIAYSNVKGTNTVIEMEFGLMDGSGPVTFQLICRNNDSGEYVFDIDSEGSWEIGKNDIDDQSFESFGKGNIELITANFQQNKMIVECDQDQLSLIINDVLIGQVSDQSYSEGYTGFSFRNESENSTRVSASYFFVTTP